MQQGQHIVGQTSLQMFIMLLLLRNFNLTLLKNNMQVKYLNGIEMDGTVTKNKLIKRILDNGQESIVPLSLGNIDYAEIMRQVDAGELTIEPADE
jgi:hypothetical protein